MQIDGSCHCGAIRYRADIDETKVRICHCGDCQTLSGGPFRVMVSTPEDNFTLLTGTPKIYLKTADSGNVRQQAFCGDCGTPLYATSHDGGPRQIGLRVGAIKQRDQLIPNRQFWRRSAQGWLDGIATIPSVETQ